jgi:hypothetical protein
VDDAQPTLEWQRHAPPFAAPRPGGFALSCLTPSERVVSPNCARTFRSFPATPFAHPLARRQEFLLRSARTGAIHAGTHAHLDGRALQKRGVIFRHAPHCPLEEAQWREVSVVVLVTSFLAAFAVLVLGVVSLSQSHCVAHALRTPRGELRARLSGCGPLRPARGERPRAPRHRVLSS